MAIRLYQGETFLGTIHDPKIDFPHLYGRWEPATPEMDSWVRSQLDKESESLVVRIGESQGQSYISSLEGTEINLRMG